MPTCTTCHAITENETPHVDMRDCLRTATLRLNQLESEEAKRQEKRPE